MPTDNSSHPHCILSSLREVVERAGLVQCHYFPQGWSVLKDSTPSELSRRGGPEKIRVFFVYFCSQVPEDDPRGKTMASQYQALIDSKPNPGVPIPRSDWLLIKLWPADTKL